MSSPKHILVAVDFTPTSNVAVDEAFSLAARLNAKVSLLHVFTLQDKRESELRPVGSFERLEHSAHAKLATMASARRASGHLGEVLYRAGDPAAQIVLCAEHIGADMIVVGATGRSVLTRLRLGSVASAVANDARCSVLIVRHPNPVPGLATHER